MNTLLFIMLSSDINKMVAAARNQNKTKNTKEREKAKKEEKQEKQIVKDVAQAVTGSVSAPRGGASIVIPKAIPQLQVAKLHSAIDNFEPGVREIAASIVLPTVCNAERANDGTSSDTTALCSTFDKHATPTSAIDGTAVNVVKGAGFGLLKMDDPLHICTEMAAPTTTKIGTVYLDPPSGDLVPTATRVLPRGSFQIPFCYLLWPDFSEKQYANTLGGDPGSSRFIWIDNESALATSIVVSALPASAAANAQIVWYRFDGETLGVVDIKESGLQVSGTISSTYVTTSSGYYACAVFTTSVFTGGGSIGLGTSAVMTYGLAITAGNNAGRLISYPIVGLEAIAKEVDGMRVLSAALMYSNMGPVMNSGGFLYAANLPARLAATHVFYSASTFALIRDPTSVVSELPGSVQLDAITGLYGWARPANAGDYFRFNDYFTVSSNGTIISSFAAILGPCPAVVVAWKLPTAEIGANMSLVTTYYATYEFQSPIQGRERRKADKSAQQWTKALALLSQTPQFMENPVHVKALKSFFNGAGQFLRGVRGLNKDARATIREIAPNVDTALRILTGA